MCYTYDNLSRVTARTVKKLSDKSVVSTETFNYDAADVVSGVFYNCKNNEPIEKIMADLIVDTALAWEFFSQYLMTVCQIQKVKQIEKICRMKFNIYWRNYDKRTTN